MKQNQSSKSGSGLIFAVVLLFVILAMVITLSSITVLETKMSQKTKSSVGAFYNSESGVEWALNKIANSSGTAAISTLGSCPFTGCSVLFLGADGKVLATSATIDQVKAVRSVGSQGGETQRAIEAAVAETGSASFTYYCNFSGSVLPTPPNICTDAGGAQGYCPSGFRQIYDLGSWGACHYDTDSDYFRPPGGGCDYSWFSHNPDLGEAYVCSQ